MKELKKQFDVLSKTYPGSMPLLKKGWEFKEATEKTPQTERPLFRVCDSKKNNSKAYVANNLYKTISTLINLDF